MLQHGKIVANRAPPRTSSAARNILIRALLAQPFTTMQPPPRRSPCSIMRKAVEVIGLDKTYVSGGGWFPAGTQRSGRRRVRTSTFCKVRPYLASSVNPVLASLPLRASSCA